MGMYFSLLGVSVVAIVLAAAGATSQVSTELLASVAFAAATLVWLAMLRKHVRLGLGRTRRLLWYPAAVALACVTFAGSSVFVRLLVHFVDIQEINLTRPLLDAGLGWPTIVLVLCVQPAVFEELAFRGVIQDLLSQPLGTRDSVIVSAVLFMVLHLTVLSFPHLFLLGLVLGYIRWRSGSLYPCMLLHFTHNLLVILMEMKGL